MRLTTATDGRSFSHIAVPWLVPPGGFPPEGGAELHQPHAHIIVSPEDRFRSFVARARSESAWDYYEIDASTSPRSRRPKL